LATIDRKELFNKVWEPDDIVEFIWIMSKYNASKREDIEELIRTPSIWSLIYQYMTRVNELLKKF